MIPPSAGYSALDSRTFFVDDQPYPVQVRRAVALPPEAPRLLIVAYQPNPTAAAILRACIRSIRRFTPEPHELWVLDNHSPGEHTRWLLDEPGVNLVLSHKTPLPPEVRRSWKFWERRKPQQHWGSYANAAGFELGLQAIDPHTSLLLTLHMDTLACRPGWLSYLRSKLDGQVRLAGVHLSRSRVPEGALHILGCLLDFQLFRTLKLDFLPDLPRLDVGDRITVKFRQAGYQVFACGNTFDQPALAEKIDSRSPFRELPVFRALDDDFNVIFMHLARGVRKTTGEHTRGLSAEEWIEFTEHVLLAEDSPQAPL